MDARRSRGNLIFMKSAVTRQLNAGCTEISEHLHVFWRAAIKSLHPSLDLKDISQAVHYSMRSNFLYTFLCSLLFVFALAAPAECDLGLDARKESGFDSRDDIRNRGAADYDRRDESAEDATDAVDGADVADTESATDAEAARKDATGRCPAGKVPRTKYVKILVDGCSVPKWLSFADMKRFTGCCNAHDKCYAACGRSKRFCDSQFHNCMLGTCGRFNLLCRAAANTYFDAMSFPEAQRSFDRATKRYCRCH